MEHKHAIDLRDLRQVDEIHLSEARRMLEQYELKVRRLVSDNAVARRSAAKFKSVAEQRAEEARVSSSELQTCMSARCVRQLCTV